MLRRALAAVLLLFGLGAVDAGAAACRAAPLPTREYAVADREVVVHYWRPSGDYQGWNLWAWEAGRDGRQIDFGVADEAGAVARWSVPGSAQRVGFIARKGEWEQKDGTEDRFIDLANRGTTEVWLAAGDAAVHASAREIDRSPRFVRAFLDSRETITVVLNAMPDANTMKTFKVRAGVGGQRTIKATSVLPIEGLPSIALRLAKPAARAEIGTLEVLVADAWHPVFARGVLNHPDFETQARLGPVCESGQTSLTTWSPVSSRVELELFESGLERPSRTVELLSRKNGLWSATVEGDLHGLAYRVAFTHYGDRVSAVDIHGVAATPDGSHTVFADLARLEPPGWAQDRGPALAQPTDDVIYEVHVRDFTVADASCPREFQGRYLGLIHEGSVNGSPSALAHLRALGVTTLHLMPIHDFTADRDAYNWGYWTALFNVPESNYASEQGNPLAPIRELRTAIQGLHQAGVRVALDVVYNHTSSSGATSPFEATVPYWFFRTTRDGTLTNDAGCGNSVADEQPMVRRYILDSLEFWLREYHVDGFRFDLLGTHEPDTVRAIVERVRAIKPDATLYGEPWTGGGRVRFGKGAQKGAGIAVFNDHYRNALRGDLDGAGTGFVNGGGGDTTAVTRGVMGSIDDFTASPTETINYVSAHDNLCLFDKLAKSTPSASDADLAAMARLSVGAVLLAQGIPFLEGGCEIARTKGGDHNSYQSGDRVNAFDWSRATESASLRDWVAGMIALRKAHPALRMASADGVRQSIEWLDSGSVLAWTIDGRASQDSARLMLVALNGTREAATLALPVGDWELLADAERAGTTPLRRVTGSLLVPPRGVAVLESAPAR